MKILLLGKSGQIGQELRRNLSHLDELTSLGREDVDLGDQDALAQALVAHRPDVLVNAAGYTAVDLAESQRDTAARVNTDAVAVMARYAKDMDALLVHFSTDYVFDGTKTSPYVESDSPNPQNVYGVTKHAGEAVIQSSQCAALILRCSWVYAAHGHNFPNTILRLAHTCESLDVVVDQIGAPTSAGLIADVTVAAIRKHRDNALPSGIYHLAASGSTSWYDYARYLVAGAAARGIILRLTPDGIHPVTTQDYPAAAKRPHNSRLDTSRLSTALGLHFADWTRDVDVLLEELSQRAVRAGEHS